ncbi:MAG TPA: DUF370 domain-containing protein [Clostridiales bacterium]|jgi:hypothetical protein|nr:DUF370 domain-containing protein [Clostridiales bacterium]
MYIHIGQNAVIREKNVIGIFDMDAVTVTKTARDFLSDAEKDGRVIYLSPYDLPKSFIVCKEDGKLNIYISPLSTSTIKNRIFSKNL